MVATVWLLIVLAVTQNVVVPLGGSGRFINMSAFDLVVPLCVLAVWWMRELHQPPYMILRLLTQGATSGTPSGP